MDQLKNKIKLHDPQIAFRVKKYLEDHVEKRYVNIPDMVQYLQQHYPEYSRRKLQPFRQLVHQAYQLVSKELMDNQASSDDSEQSDLEEVMADSSSNNVMSNMMNNLYNKQAGNSVARPQTSTTPAVAIDISSDESCDGTISGGKSAANHEKINEALSKLPRGCSVNSSTGNNTVASLVDQKSLKRRDSSHHQTPPNAPRMKKRKDANNEPIENDAVTSANTNVNAANSAAGSNLNSNDHGINSRTYARLPSINTIRGNNIDDPSQPHTHPTPSNKKKYKKSIILRKSNEAFRDIGGMEAALKELCEILMHVKSPDAYFALGLIPPRGILLHGPSGCGKTLLAHAIAGQLDIPICEVPATEFIAGVSGESEQRIRDIFEQAGQCSPCLLFIDEIDAISSNRSMAQRDMERRIVSQLISSIDELKRSPGGHSVLIVGATARPDVLDPALRRVGRFDHEIAIGVPNRKDRKQILEIICEGLCVEGKCDFDNIAALTPGFVGADLLALVSRAAVIAVKRICTEQLHEFQTKALTIVDLDGDEAGDEEGMDVDLSNVKQQEKNGEKVTNETSVEGGENGKPDDKEKTQTEEKKTEESVVNSSVSETKDPKENEADSSEAKSEETKTDQQIVKKQSDTIALHDPTLYEMINLLENPLDLTHHLGDFYITYEDMKQAIKQVQPSAKREGFITVPDTEWDDVGSLHDIREELQLAVLAPVKYPEMLQRLGLTAPSGVLLCGPPGCGKTLLAKAIAHEAGINFISVKGPELMNMYVGESERAVRACFQRARNSAPCVIFFDEFDSLCPKRSDGNDTGSGTRIVNQLLTEMDGVEDRKGVYILAATNRPDIIDPAILRPGRLDTILYVGLPKEEDRVEILTATTKNRTRPVLADDVDFKDIAAKTDGYTGADLAGLVKQASMVALKEAIKSNSTQNSDICVSNKHFEEAIKLFRPSVTPQDRLVYEKLRQKYAAPRSAAE